MLKQPVGIKLYTNISIVRLKFGKRKYEIACYKNKVQDYRDKKETDITEVLQTNEIYKNVVQGDIAPASELKKVFPDLTHEDIVKLILEKGVIQVSEKERTTTTSSIKNDIANIIVAKTYNTETGLPFPHDMIIGILDEYKFKIIDNQDAKKQAISAIKFIKDKGALPIERKMMQLNITIKNKETLKEGYNTFCEEFMKFLNDNGSVVIEENIKDADSFGIKVNIKPNFYRDLLNKYEKILSCEIMSNEVIGPIINNENEKEGESIKDEKEIKIANSNVDKFIEDNYKDEIKTDKGSKKKIKCTKCKGAAFDDHEELKKHYKTKWHEFNALRSAKGKESFSAEEFDEYVLMNPEAL